MKLLHASAILLATGAACWSTPVAYPSKGRKGCVLHSRLPFTTVRRTRGGASCTAVYGESELKEGIANFYDTSSGLWEDMWGEHMHHGYYPEGKKKNHRQAQVDMVDAVLAWAGVERPATVLDVGCGIGGSSRHLVRKYGCKATGITLSPVQAARGNAITQAQGLGDSASFQVADALNMPFPDNSFDLIWSMESGEHMPDKAKFMAELTRVLKPGGRVLVVTWCHRDLEAGEDELKPGEQELLARINKAYYLPEWCSVADYVALAEGLGLQEVKRDDWTDSIRHFWPAVIRSALSVQGLLGLLRTGPTVIRGALAMRLMVKGYKRGTIKFGLITATKPPEP